MKKVALILTSLALVVLFVFISRPKPPSSPEIDKIEKESLTLIPSIPNATDSVEDLEVKKFEETFGKLSKEELDSKPKGVSWRQWGHFVAFHRTKKLSESEVEFYGIVIDDNGDPIVGATLQAKLPQTPKLSEAIESKSVYNRYKIIDLRTDSEGKFTVKDFTASSVRIISLKKPGYKIPGKKTAWGFSFDPGDPYSLHKPDKNNPVEFKLVKNQ